MIRVFVVLTLLLTNAQGISDGEEEPILTWKSLMTTVKQRTSSFVRSALPTMMRIVWEANISSECEQGLTAYGLALMRWKPWALRMIDASGKVPSGILEGTAMDFGAFEECLDIRVNDSSKNLIPGRELFRGRYCTVGFQSGLLSSSLQTHEAGNYSNRNYPEILVDVIERVGTFSKRPTFWMGICLPSGCTEGDIQRLTSAITKSYGIKSSMSDCYVDEPFVWPASSIAALFVVSCLATLCAIGTFLDVIGRTRLKEIKPLNGEDKHFVLKILKSFSIWSNSEMLFKSTYGNDIRCFHGIKFLTATWIVLGHAYVVPHTWKFVKSRHAVGFFEIFGKIPEAIIENFTISISTFFVLSGYLLVKTTWDKLKYNRRRNVFEFFVHKYWRMTPALIFILLLLYILPVTDSGPLWNSTINPYIRKCNGYWWANFLYINNWFSMDAQCLEYTWFLAALMQLHIVGVCLLLITYRWKLCGIILTILITVACLAVASVEVLWRNYTFPIPSKVKDPDQFEDYVANLYIRPYFHFTSYLVGMMTAYIVEKYGERKIPVIYQVLGWLVAVFLALFSIYAPYLPTENRGFTIFYLTTHRTLWAVSVGWLIYICVSGFGGVVNRLLSHSILQPLGKLSYLIYLSHVLVMLYKDACSRERTYFGHTEQVFSFFSTLDVTLILAYLGHVAMEVPFLKLENLAFRRRPKE